MTYEEYKKEGLCTTKEQYVQMQKNNLANEIKGEKSMRNICMFASLAVPTLIILATKEVVGDYYNSFSLVEQLTCGIPTALFTIPYLYMSIKALKKIKELQSKNVELPTDLWMEDYNQMEYHRTEVNRYKSKTC